MTALTVFCPPMYQHVPPHVGTYGAEVADLADSAGMTLDPEQRLVIDAMYAHDERGRLVASEVGGCSPRQNLKTHVAKAAALADLVLFDEPDGLWTAHLRSTSDASYGELVEMFENFDHLRRLVHSTPDSDGEKAIVLRRPAVGEAHPRLTFMTRSERGGRGLTGRKITYDEALFLKPSMTSAMVPILSAQSMSGLVQLRYFGSPGLLQSQVWREVRDRGRAGDASRLTWFEWAARRVQCELEDRCSHKVGMPGCALDREDLVREGNLAIGRRMDIGFVLGTERLAMTPADYMRERFGWWQDPVNTDGGDLDFTQWQTLADPGAERGTSVVFGVDVGEDRLASIAVAWQRPDGAVQLMLTVDETGEVDAALSPLATPTRLLHLATTWNGRVVLGGPAAMLEQDLPGVPVTVLSGTDFATGCGKVEDLLKSRGLRHGNQPELNAAVATARWRSVGTAGERAWQLKGAAGIGPLAAATRALHGLLFGNPAPPAAPQGVRTSEADVADIAAVTF